MTVDEVGSGGGAKQVQGQVGAVGSGLWVTSGAPPRRRAQGSVEGRRRGKSPSSVRGIGPVVWDKHPSTVMAGLSAHRERVCVSVCVRDVATSESINPPELTRAFTTRTERSKKRNAQNENALMNLKAA